MGSTTPNESHPPIPPPSTSLVHHLIHDRATTHPNSEAVSSWDCTLRYSDLDVLSSRLASHLTDNGVGPEVIVPLLFEKSAWALVGMLAVMRAGGAFMTLDISQPEDRLRSLVQQSGARIALASGACYDLCLSMVATTVKVTHFSLAELDTSGALWPSQWPAEAHNAVYVMATSGSTGTPKLVVTEHSQLSSFVAYLTEPLGFGSQTRAFQFASYAFDPIIGDTFLTLCAGGTVCVPSEDERKNDLVGAMQRMRVNLAKFTPSLVSSLMGSLTPETVPSLKTLVLGGETASEDVITAWAGHVDLRLIYGSTECTISCVVGNVGQGNRLPGEIGRPVGSRAWVVDPANHHELTGDGEIGELVLEGPLVSRGYMNNPSQTEARYIKPTAWSSSYSRLYRTGDLVRRLHDQRLLYVGRVDNQIKIHGQRLELEEVELHVRRVLSSLPEVQVKNVLVDFVAPFGATAKQLVGILSVEGNFPIGSLVLDAAETRLDVSPETQKSLELLVSGLEIKLKSMVPAYMVPTLWIPIDEMPYTLSRKKDRQRLRMAIESLPANTLSSFHRTAIVEDNNPLTEKEELVKKLWSSTLGLELEAIRPTDNFFLLGGNSLLVLRLISMIRQTDYRLTVDDVFRYPRLRDLASKLRLATKINMHSHTPCALLEPSNVGSIRCEAARQCGVGEERIKDIVPLYSMQQHYITGYPEIHRDIDGAWAWQQQIVFSLPDGFEISRFKSVWSALIKRHVQLRTRVIKSSHGIFQAILSPDSEPTWYQGFDLGAYVVQDRALVMTFGDRLLRLAIVQSGQESYFVMTMHHLIYDAFSREILFRELEAGYIQHTLPTTEPPNITEFIKYVNMEADRTSAVKFWTSYLDGAAPKPLLSTPLGGRPVNEIKTHTMTMAKTTIPSSSEYTLATIIEVSAALAIAQLQTLNESDYPRDVIFYSDRAGRNLPVEGISDLVAPTTLFLPLRVHIDASQMVDQLLLAHQNANKDMIPHEHINWTELREMEHLREILKHSVNININPYTPLGRLGTEMGLKVVDEHENGDDPFGINVSVRDEDMEWVLYFDEAFISGEAVRELAARLKMVFSQLVSRPVSGVNGEVDATVGDVFRAMTAKIAQLE